jgi:predicted secreted protein
LALAAHLSKFFVRNDTTAPTPVTDEPAGINNVSFSPSVDLLDVTDFKDTTGAKLKLAALKDGSASLSGDLDLADAPQGLIRTAYDNGSIVHVTFQFNPSGGASAKGFRVPCYVESYEIGAAVADRATFSCSLQFTGLMVAI